MPRIQRQTLIRIPLWTLTLIAMMLFSSCGLPFQTTTAAIPTATDTPRPTPVARRGTATPAPTGDSGASSTNLNNLLLYQRALEGPYGWVWRTSLPFNRLVIYYGNPLSPVMGPIGQFSDSDLVAHLQAQAQVYQQLDPSHPVVPALDYVTPVAQGQATADGTWIYRMPDDSIQHYISLANNNHMLFFFDMQIGHSTVQREVAHVWNYLQMPGVELALDPEFDMAPGDTPGVEFGRMYASEINGVINELSTLVQQQHLPPKILIIHQFLQEMLPDWQKIKLQPGVQVVTSVDGFGSPSAKMDDYRMFDKDQLIQYPGMKLFYRLDKPLMSPRDVLNLNPPPVMVMYQ